MNGDAVYSMFAIFVGAAALATAALVARQAMLVAYILLGVLLGPAGMGLISDTGWIAEVAEIGIIFLLYLLGLNMVPQQLFRTLREVTEVVVLSCAVFAAIAALIAAGFGFSLAESLVIGATAMFSSTILGLKLLPTTTLHHQHMGDVMVGMLLLQDVIAIVLLLTLQGLGKGGTSLLLDVGLQIAALPALALLAFALEHWLIEPLIRRYDRIHEYIFLVVIAWCLGMAEAAHLLGLSREIGAFVAGVALASSPIALFVADSLKPLRDFFLILFFFSLGAGFNTAVLKDVWLPSLLLAGAMVVIKPLVFRRLLLFEKERTEMALEIGVRLGQFSEFAFLIAVIALVSGVIGSRASAVIQVATLLTFVISAYWTVARYPTPIAVRDSLRRD